MDAAYMEQLAAMQGYGEKATAPTAEQRTPQWLMERIGHCTASKFAAVMDYTKTGSEGAKRRNYRVQLILERLTGKPAGNWVSDAMQWGTDTEPAARMAYVARTGALVDEVGFIHHQKIERVGGSPDGCVAEDGLIEIKCPYEPGVHVTTFLQGMPPEHIPQIQGYLWIMRRQWCDFISFDPRMPDGLKLYMQRVPRDDKYIEALEIGVLKFLDEVAAQMETLKQIAAKVPG